MPMGQPYPKPDPRSPRRGRQQPKQKKVAPRKPAPAPKRKPRGDAWSKNDELLYKLMGGKSKTKYAEDQATYREFGRTYGGPTDAASVAMRKRRERGDYSFGEKPKKRMGHIAPKQKKGRGGNKKAGPSEDMRKRKRYDSLMGYKPVFVGTPPKKIVKKNNMDSLLFSLGFAKKGKPRKGVKKIESKAPKNSKRGAR